jgi:hypothetical protein
MHVLVAYPLASEAACPKPGQCRATMPHQDKLLHSAFLDRETRRCPMLQGTETPQSKLRVD